MVYNINPLTPLYPSVAVDPAAGDCAGSTDAASSGASRGRYGDAPGRGV